MTVTDQLTFLFVFVSKITNDLLSDNLVQPFLYLYPKSFSLFNTRTDLRALVLNALVPVNEVVEGLLSLLLLVLIFDELVVQIELVH